MCLSNTQGDEEGRPVALRSFVLHEVQALHGGCVLWAGQDRTAIVQVIEPGLWERRYKIKLNEEQWTEIERLVGAHRFLTLEMPQRNGIPDEALAIIAVTTRDGETAKSQKWANDKHPDFDPIHDYLRGLCRAEGDLIREGPFSWDWRPQAFECPW